MNQQSAPDFTGISEISRKTTGEHIFGNTPANIASGRIASVFSCCRFQILKYKLQKFNVGRSNEKDFYGMGITLK